MQRTSSPAHRRCENCKCPCQTFDDCAYSKVRAPPSCSAHSSNPNPGIYPREPRNKKKVSKRATPSTTFYYTKDIQYLLHEPLLNKFRDHKALAKKIGRALGRGEVGDAARLERSKPRMRLDHIIKERYPTFVDALRDLDDALSMLFLFANLPSTTHIPPKTIALCQRLCLEFEHYLIVTNSLKKSFLSIKGIYYQATIHGQDILWLVPYKFVQRMTGDIDFRIMGTFIEFYTTLLGFTNYRLYTSIGLVYPPKFDSASDERGAELGAITLEGKAISSSAIATNGASDDALHATTVDAQAEADKVAELEDQDGEAGEDGQPEWDAGVDNDAIDTFEPAAAQDADILPQPQFTSTEAANLFSDFTFFLSRETPRAPLEFILKAFGCRRVGWDAVLGEGAFTSDEKDPAITHQLVDRPNLPANAFADVPVESDEESIQKKSTSRVPGRTYIQPQWVWDCINQGKLLRPDLYAPGATLPPHLSPWVKAKQGQYDPTAPLAEQEKEGEAELHEEELEEEEDEALDGADLAVKPLALTYKLPVNSLLDQGDVDAGEGMQVDGSDSGVDSDSDASEQRADWSGVSSESDAELSDTELSRLQYQREIEAETKGHPFTAADADSGSTPGKQVVSEARKKADRKKKEREEELERQRMMLPNRKRKLFDKMQHGNKIKDDEAEKLRKKKRRLEKVGKGGTVA
jgi:pescadillo protein